MKEDSKFLKNVINFIKKLGYKRKEKEIKNRGILIIKNLVKPDKELHSIFKNKWEKKYKGSCEKVFSKEYENISSQDLAIFIDNFIRRIYILKKCFPYSLAYVLFGVLKHPNLNLTSKNVKNLYNKIRH